MKIFFHMKEKFFINKKNTLLKRIILPKDSKISASVGKIGLPK
jgi:hypothetical protein